MSTSRLIIVIILFTVALSQTAFSQTVNPIRFDQQIKPILSNHCWSCHGPDEAGRKAGLRLDLLETALSAAESGAMAIVPGDPDRSELIARIESHDADLQMPPASVKKPLNEQQRQVLRQWISEGAPFSTHWAFRTAERPTPPDVQDSNWIRNEIDRFVLKRLEDEKLHPSDEASPAVWLRRVTLDLTGLPPSIEELNDFELQLQTSPKEQVYAAIVDRLLQSPRYGERMAMLWLDAARYADTNGYNNDETRTMWPWRDWVINAFTTGMPYDQFLTEQLAGDLLPDATISQKVATGFSRNHVLTTEGGIIEEEYHVEYVADRVHTTATVFLAISMQCARCHDHKFDPISQRDYYQFASFFNNVPDKVVSYNQTRMAEPLLKIPSPEQTAELKSIETRTMEIDQLLAAKTAEAEAEPMVNPLQAERDVLVKRREELEAAIPATMIMSEPAEPRPAFILKRGQYDQRGEQVESAFPQALTAAVSREDSNSSSQRTRLDLARWLTDPDHPLTARVAVNRWWEMLFGTGLVETSDDFGIQGSLPSHPELLDWLATELIRQKWDQRSVLKAIVLSATYRQSSKMTPDLLERDPSNLLLARGTRYRLPAETVRDAALFVSGLFKEHIGGPSVKPYQPEGLWEDVSVERRDKYIPDTGDGLYRRSMYTFWKRTCPPPGMATFDAPDREFCLVRRARTNTPLQALVLLNDPTFVEAARKLAERCLLTGSNDTERLNHAFRIVLCRIPDDAERETLLSILAEASREYDAFPATAEELLSIGHSSRDPGLMPAQLAAWTTVMSVLLNLDEAISKL